MPVRHRHWGPQEGGDSAFAGSELWGRAKPRGRILLVDDTPSMLKFMHDGLRTAGFGVVAATGGSEAFEEFGKGGFDFVVTDLNMPNAFAGMQLIKNIRRVNPGQRIILASIDSDKLTTFTRQDIGADAYWDKKGQKDISGLLAILGDFEKQAD